MLEQHGTWDEQFRCKIVCLDFLSIRTLGRFFISCERKKCLVDMNLAFYFLPMKFKMANFMS